MAKKTRSRVILERWGTLAVYAVLGAGAYLLLERFVLGWLLATLQEEWVLGLSTAGLLVIALLTIGIDLGPRLARVAWSLPPVWFAGIFGSAGLVAWAPLLGLSDEIEFRAESVVVLLLVPVTWVVLGHLRPRSHGRRAPDESRTQISSTKGAASIEELDELQLIEWLDSDEEINSPEQDRFGAAIAARRIAKRLSDPSSPSVAIVGEVGSGKSSLAELVRGYLCETDGNTLFVRVSLWPFETSEAAVRGVLSELVRKVGERAPTLSVRTVPQNYARSVEGSGTIGAMIGPHLASRSAREVVEVIDELLSAAGLRVIVCIEDLERFGGLSTEGSASDGATDELLAPVYAMLYQLDDAKAISVLVATTSLRMRLDAHKIVRFIERTPTLEPETAMGIVMEVRQYCRRITPGDMIEVLPDSQREYLPRDQQWTRYWLSDLTRRHPLFPECIAHLLCTPRVMKSALRLFVDRWRTLCGEADIDHVLVSSILQCGSPEVFALLESRIHAFRREGKEPPIATQSVQSSDIREDLEKLLLSIADSRKAASVRQLVGFLFPQSNIGWVVRPALHPQGVSLAKPTDYWRRILSEPIVPQGESDQWLLKVIQNWVDARDKQLAALAVDGQWTSRLRQFRRQMKASDLCRLLEAVADIHASEDGSDWNRSDPDGIVTLCLLCLDGRIRSSMLAETLRRIIDRHGASHLPLLSAIAYWFVATRNSSSDPVGDPGDRQLLRKAIIEAMVGATSSSESFGEALKSGSVYTLRHLTLADWRDWEDVGPVWPKIREALIALAGLYPELARSQTIPLLVDTEHRSELAESDDGWHPATRSRTVIRSNVAEHFSDADICAIFAGTDFIALAELYPELQHAIPAVEEYVNEKCVLTDDCAGSDA